MIKLYFLLGAMILVSQAACMADENFIVEEEIVKEVPEVPGGDDEDGENV